MGSEAITAALCWFTIGGALAVNSLNNVESESRLYRTLPSSGVYASGAPYGAYSFQIPLVSAPKPAALHAAPAKEQNFSFHNMNAYLKDSYGNRFVESKQSPQTVPFKPFPQQYIQLQELPAHFAQPIPAPSFAGYKQVTPQITPSFPGYKQDTPQNTPSFAGYKQATPQVIVGSPYRLPLQPLQTVSPVKQLYNFPHGVYASNFKNLAPQPITHSQQFHGSVFQLPFPSQAYNMPGKGFNFGSKVTHSPPRLASPSPTALQQSTSSEATYANAHSSEEQYNHSEEPKFQPTQEQQPTPYEESSEEDLIELPRHEVKNVDKIEQKVPVRETTVTSFMDGRKTRVNLKTKAPVPLLDISLLEPLTFDNPLVPQVQHYLPKISQATYHKLPEFTQNSSKKNHKSTQKTKSYDSGNDKVKPKKFIPKKKQRYPIVEVQNSFYDEIPSASTVRPVVTVKETPNESPEFSYEINSPNYKETYKEQAINYNKETQSEPVHYTYGTEKHEEPVHYTYVHSSKEPIHITEVHYEGKGEGPKHILQKFKSDDKKEENQHESEDSGESSEDDSPPHRHTDHRYHHTEHVNNNKHHEKKNHHNENHNHHHDNHNQNHGHHNQHHKSHNQKQESPKTPQQRPEHREQQYHQKSNSVSHQNHQDNHNSFKPIQYYTKTSSGAFQPVSEYEEEIRIAAQIKVDPGQHTQPQSLPRQQNPPSTQQHNFSSAPHNQPTPQHNPAPHQSFVPHYKTISHQNSAPNSQQKHHTPTTHVHEKTKSVIIQEEIPEHFDEDDSKGMFGKEVDKEKDFEKAYHNAAFGFPAYGKKSDDDIFNPENYGAPREHNYFDFKNSPFEQYQAQADNFPKSSRLSYKDIMDKTKEDYFLDYSISKPESLTDLYKKKIDYYKMYKNQKPDKYIAYDDANQKKQKNEKYTSIPYSFYPTQDLNMKQFLAQYKASPFVQEFDYSKAMPRDNSAHSTQPLHRYKSNTFFVEPQFQYGFEPISIPRLLDSELATMASNNSPESEKPGTRKKIYKENFYIKKTSLTDGLGS